MSGAVGKRINVVENLVRRGMFQSFSIPEKKPGAGRKVYQKRTPDLRASDSSTGHSGLALALTHMKCRNIMEKVTKLVEAQSAVYCGFDPTSDSLHLGHITVIAPLLQLARTGLPVIGLIGGATSRLGDPSGKKESRKLIQKQILHDNALALENQLSRIFHRFSEKHNLDSSLFRILNNDEWYKDMTIEDYKSNIAKHFKMVDMLDRAVVKSRLSIDKESDRTTADIRFPELVYQTFQSYDWLHLYQNYNCSIQVGGYDQLGNIEDGYSYVWKSTNTNPPLAGMTVPLVVTSSGEKLGKTSNNAVWLDQNKTSMDDMRKYLNDLSPCELKDLCLKLTAISIEEINEMDMRSLKELLMTEFTYLTS